MKLGVGAAMVAAGDVLFWQKGMSGGYFGIYGLILLVGTITFRPALRRDWRAVICLGLAALAALAMLFDPGLLAWTLFWIFAGLAALLPATARFGDAWQWTQRLVLHGFRASVGPLLDLLRLQRVRRKRGGVQLRGLLPQLALPLVGSVVILALFSSANPVIEQALAGLLDLSWLWPNPLRLAVWAVLFTLGWSLLRPRLPRALLGTFDGSGDLTLPGFTADSVRLSLIAFNALFALQNLMDLAWLWGLMPLPKELTLASYAHRGAYPLVVTALLAAGFVLVALRPGSETSAQPLIRRLVVLWVAQNLLLVANAALRTLDYIGSYSLTSLRIAALLWMGLVALGLVLVLWRMMRQKSAAWLINSNAAAAIALLMACSVVDLDAVSAGYNISHARELGGDGAPIDMCFLQRIGPSALLPLANIELNPAPEPIHLMARLLRENAQVNLAGDLAGGRWSLLGEMRMASLRSTLRLAALAPKYRMLEDCRSRDQRAMRIAMGLERAPALPAEKLTLTPSTKP